MVEPSPLPQNTGFNMLHRDPSGCVHSPRLTRTSCTVPPTISRCWSIAQVANRHRHWFPCILIGLWLGGGSVRAQSEWPSWRGPNGNGTAETGSLPVQWSETEHVRWKFELPGRGASTPIDFAERWIVTMGIDGDNTVLAIDRDGKVAWKAMLGKERAAKHAKASSANSSPVTDGTYLFTYFKSGDLGCFTREGELVWSTNIQTRYGEDSLWWDLGTSPIVTEQAVIVTVMQTGPSFLVAFDKKTGKELWKADRWLDVREEANQSYTTPTLTRIDGQPAIVTVGADHVTAHRALDGQLLWKLGGFNPDNDGYFRSIASPVVSGDLVFCPYSRGNTLTAVKLTEKVSEAQRVAWRMSFGSDVPTPAMWKGRLFLLSDKGVVTCLDPMSGETLWKENLPKSNKAYSSSPLIADGKMYCVREDAMTFVLGDLEAKQPKLLAQNGLEGFAVASPVAIGNQLVLRTYEALYCFE
jgi:outer membrane protein assembly factor BamB